MTSESDVDWKMLPSSSSLRRKSGALTRLPLWATAMLPCAYSTANGWALRSPPPPAVE